MFTHKKELAVRMPTAAEATRAQALSTTPTQLDVEKKIIAPAPDVLNKEEQKKWTALREIMKSKNDNDPRLDKDLYNLSLMFHAELVKQYQTLPMESRNERGLIAFLIARDVKDTQDFGVS